MKKTLLLFVFIIATIAVHAQQTPPPKPKDPDSETMINEPASASSDTAKIFTAVQKEPAFPGGLDAFYKYLQQTVRYPAKSFENRIQGKVLITFIVEKDGSLTDIKVAKGVSEDIDAEAVRVMTISPKWNPGTQNAKPVRVQYTMPLSFTLAGR